MSKDGPGTTMLGNMVEALREGISSNLKKNLDPPEPPDTIMGTIQWSWEVRVELGMG